MGTNNIEGFIYFILFLLLIIVVICFIIILYFYYYIINYYFFEIVFYDTDYKELDILEVDKNLCVYLSNNKELIKNHPLINYYFEVEMFSITLDIKLRWLKYGIKFLTSIKDCLNNDEYLENFSSFDHIFENNLTIQSLNFLRDMENYDEAIFLHMYKGNSHSDYVKYNVDNAMYVINDTFNVNTLIEELNNKNKINCLITCNENYIYSEDDLIKLRLTLNIRDYIVLSSDKLFPVFKILENKNIN